MSRSSRLGPVAPCIAVAMLAAVASALGILLRGDGSLQTVTSARGETYQVATNGIYAWNAQRVVAEGIGWDLVTQHGREHTASSTGSMPIGVTVDTIHR